MQIPKEIAEKARIYEESRKAADAAFEEIVAWLRENTEADGVYITEIYIEDQPYGDDQGEGEYCSQSSVGCCGDSFEGTYYHPIEGSTKYLAYNYEC